MTSDSIVPYNKKEPDDVEIINGNVTDFSRGLNRYLNCLGLPCDNVLVEINERVIVYKNMPDVIDSLPENKREEAYYISKFIASCGAGLFDAALNYLWNETIVNLRQKVIYFDLNYFFKAIGKEDYYTEDQLKKVEDWELIKGCNEIGILSEIGFKHLNYIRDMRNFASAAHPNNTELDGLQLASWLNTCIKEVLSKNPSSPALVIKHLLPSIREEKLSESDAKPINDSIKNLPLDLANSLLIALFGMYTDEQVTLDVRNNINLLAKTVWFKADNRTKETIGLKYATFSAHGQKTRKDLAKEFIIFVDGLGYLTDDHRSIELRECLEALETAHYRANNFYTEVPHAKIIFYYVQNNNKIPDSVRSYYVKVITICKLGNLFGFSFEAEPYYDKMMGIFSDLEIKEFLLLLNDKDITVMFDHPFRADRFRNIASRFIGNTTNEVLKQALEMVKGSTNTELNNGRAFLNIKKYI